MVTTRRSQQFNVKKKEPKSKSSYHKCKGNVRIDPNTIVNKNKNYYCDFCWDRIKNYSANKKSAVLGLQDVVYDICPLCNNSVKKYKKTKSVMHECESFSNFQCIVLPSRMIGGQLGLYTLKTIAENQIITLYDGEVENYNPLNLSEYIIETEIIKRKNSEGTFDDIITKVKDGHPDKCPLNLHKLAAYANDRFPDVDENNAYFFIKSNQDDAKSTIELRASREIIANEEIYVEYGNNYFKDKKLDN